MSQHEDHGHSVAAWTAVTLLLIAAAAVCVGLVWSQFRWLIWLGVALVVLGTIAGPVLAKLGYGSKHEASPNHHTTAVR